LLGVSHWGIDKDTVFFKRFKEGDTPTNTSMAMGLCETDLNIMKQKIIKKAHKAKLCGPF